MSGHFCSQWPRYLWSGFGFPFFLMLFAVVSPKCNRPSVTLVTWSVRRSILKQTTEMSREWNRAQRLGTSGLLEPSVGFVPCSHTPQKPHTLEFLTSQHGCTKEGHRTTPCYQKLCTLQVSDPRTMNSRCLNWFLLPPQQEERHTHVCSQSLQHPAPHKRPL